MVLSLCLLLLALSQPFLPNPLLARPSAQGPSLSNPAFPLHSAFPAGSHLLPWFHSSPLGRLLPESHFKADFTPKLQPRISIAGECLYPSVLPRTPNSQNQSGFASKSILRVPVSSGARCLPSSRLESVGVLFLFPRWVLLTPTLRSIPSSPSH